MYCNSFEGKVYENSTSTPGVAGTSEATIMSYSLCRNGQSLRIKFVGLHGSNTDNVVFTLYFGSEYVASGTLATSAEICELNMDVTRVSSKVQSIYSSGHISTGPAVVASTWQAGAEDDTAAITIKLTATCGTSGVDAIAKLFRVEFLQAA